MRKHELWMSLKDLVTDEDIIEFSNKGSWKKNYGRFHVFKSEENFFYIREVSDMYSLITIVTNVDEFVDILNGKTKE